MSIVMDPVSIPNRPPVTPGAVDESAGRRQLHVNQDLLIGRGADCHLRLPALNVSRRHCLLKISAPHAWITDLGSGNGTWVNGHRLIPGKETPVTDGSRVHVGPYEFVVRIQTPSGLSQQDSPITEPLHTIQPLTMEDTCRSLEETDVPPTPAPMLRPSHRKLSRRSGTGVSADKRRTLRPGIRKTGSLSEELDISWLTSESEGASVSTVISPPSRLPEPLTDSQMTVVSPVIPPGRIPPVPLERNPRVSIRTPKRAPVPRLTGLTLAMVAGVAVAGWIWFAVFQPARTESRVRSQIFSLYEELQASNAGAPGEHDRTQEIEALNQSLAELQSEMKAGDEQALLLLMTGRDLIAAAKNSAESASEKPFPHQDRLDEFVKRLKQTESTDP